MSKQLKEQIIEETKMGDRFGLFYVRPPEPDFQNKDRMRK